MSASPPAEKPRVIIMTDGEIDDQSSMVRFLLYTCDVELLGIIQTNSFFQRDGHSVDHWLEAQIDAYEAVHPNLLVHHPDFPGADSLRKLCFIGDEDYAHLKDMNLASVKPGDPVLIQPKDWPDTPGSDRIVEVLLEDNPAPVHISVWGGMNTAARAFHVLKTQHPNDYERAVSKAVIFTIWYQDGGGPYIETEHPLATMIYSDSFSGTWDYVNQLDSRAFVAEHVKNNHGPLGELYPQDYISEGDTPAYLNLVANGLDAHLDPTLGGWGGRFEKSDKAANLYIDALEQDDQWLSVRKWIDDANADFKARMDWCVASTYEHARHAPIAIVKGGDTLTVKSGDQVTLSAADSSSPDGNRVNYRWDQDREAGGYRGLVRTLYARTVFVCFDAPNVAQTETLHFLLKVTDHAEPAMSSYRRVVITVEP